MTAPPQNGEATTHTLARVRAREDAVLSRMLAGESLNSIVKAVPISRSSLFRLRRLPQFQRRLEEARAQSFEATVNSLHSAALTFVETLKSVCEDPKSRDSARATAARSGLDVLIKSVELFDVHKRLEALEQAAAEEQGPPAGPAGGHQQ